MTLLPPPLPNASATVWLKLMRLASPALPVGGFSYSEGLESAIEAGCVRDADSAGQWLLDQLHLALPESGYASVRALKRLAHYQASSKPFGPVAFLTNIAQYLNVDVAPTVAHVPPGMVRDVGLPPFCRPRLAVAPRVAESR